MKRNTIILLIIFCVSCKTDLSLSQYDQKSIVISKVCDLPVETIESSGIFFFQGLVWTFNDSGNDPFLYGIDTVSGELVRKVYIEGAENIDWEAVSHDDDNIYIADNGNNNRTRIDYSIYIIPKDSISDNSEQTITPKNTIEYRYRESDLNKININSINVDSEAILIDDDSLYIYIKDWLYNSMSVFSIPTDKKSVEGNLGGTYELGFAVTAATRVNQNQIAFLGYKNYRSYLTILECNPQLSGTVTQIAHYELYDLQGFQTEGLTFENEKLYISCENQVVNQALFRLEFK